MEYLPIAVYIGQPHLWAPVHDADEARKKASSGKIDRYLVEGGWRLTGDGSAGRGRGRLLPGKLVCMHGRNDTEADAVPYRTDVCSFCSLQLAPTLLHQYACGALGLGRWGGGCCKNHMSKGFVRLYTSEVHQKVQQEACTWRTQATSHITLHTSQEQAPQHKL